jgi:ubiquinone/menaquinone biosynthesis C-methylase UbiE
MPWDLVSDGYTSFIAPAFSRYADVALDRLGVGPGSRVADVACGPGTLALQAAARGASVRALDFSPAMVERARLRCAGADVDVEPGDGQHLPWPDATFDAAASMFGLMFFPDRVRGLRELARVVRPGGRIAITSWPPQDVVPEFVALFTAIQEVLPDLPPSEPFRPMSSEAEIRAETNAAGLSDVSLETVRFSLEATSLSEFWTAMERSLAPLAMLRARLADSWGDVGPKLAGAFERRLGPGPVRAEMPAWLTVARVP